MELMSALIEAAAAIAALGALVWAGSAPTVQPIPVRVRRPRR